jgi:hypothetical protein
MSISRVSLFHYPTDEKTNTLSAFPSDKATMEGMIQDIKTKAHGSR